MSVYHPGHHQPVMQECLSLEGSKAGLQSRLAEQEANIGQVKAMLPKVHPIVQKGLVSPYHFPS